MSGEWLKFDKATPDKPEVFGIASELGIDPDAVVGKLMRVWSWFDTHTEFGNAASVTSALLDRIAGITGFVSAMQKVGWIEPFEQGLRLPKFERHCGETAKKRAQNNKRVNDFRARNAPSVTDACTREEEEKKKKKQKQDQKTAPEGDLLAEVDPQVAADFKALRVRLRSPITPTAMAGIRREADKAGMTLGEALAMCCERGWRGFKAEWVGEGRARGSPTVLPPSKTLTAIETLQRMKSDGNLDSRRDSGRLEQTALLVAGTHAGR